MILITGAAGKSGRAIINALKAAGEPTRAIVHRIGYVDAVTSAGAQETVVGDMGDQRLLLDAMRGVRAVYHIAPNVSPREVEFGQLAIDAAVEAGVSHFVYHSVLHPQTQRMPHHWLKLQVEEALFESGVPYTILQPAAYMQNIIAQWASITAEGVFPVPYPAGTRLSMVDLEDVAQVAALVLSQANHVGAIYELAGPDALTQLEVAEILGRELGRPVSVEQISVVEWRRSALARGMNEYQVDTLVRMFGYYERYGFWGNPQVLTWLLGRKPTDLAAFIRRTIDRESSGRE